MVKLDDLLLVLTGYNNLQNLAAEVVALEEKVLQLTSAALQQSHEGRSGSQQAQDEGMQVRVTW